MSYTVWSYDWDAAAFHNNNLAVDTFDDIKKAERIARQRVRESMHNTGWANVVDNRLRGHLGDCGVVAGYHKTTSGRVRLNYKREGLVLRAPAHAAH